MNLVEIQNLSKSYSGHRALDHLDLNIPEGSVFGLLGPNGAGKTTLIRIMNRIIIQDEGRVLWKGSEIVPSHTDLIGYMPEERGLYKKMQIGEQAIYLAQLKGMSRRDAIQKLKFWFRKFELETWWKKKVEDLSKGMQQKIQFIVTIIHGPKLLILDEPFSGFDPINANLVRDEMLELNKNGTTIILSTHRMESVEALCSHIALINKSKKILDGTVREIRNNNKSNIFEISYTGEVDSFRSALPSAYQILESKSEEELTRMRIQFLDHHQPNDLLKLVLPIVQVRSLHEVIPSMEDIFISKVNAVEL